MFMVLPVVMCFFYGFTNWDGMSKNFRFIGFSNYLELFSDQRVIGPFLNTLVITVVTTVIYNVLGILLALMMDKAGKVYRFAKSAFFIPTILSSVVVGFIWSYMIQTDGGVVNTLLNIIGLPSINLYSTPFMTILTISMIITWQGMGLFTTIYLATLSTIPQELNEAATVDGASPIRKFFKITLPLLMPGITLNCILALTGGLKQFDIVKVVTNGGPGFSTQTIVMSALSYGVDYMRRGYSTAILFILFLVIGTISVIQLSITKKFEVDY